MSPASMSSCCSQRSRSRYGPRRIGACADQDRQPVADRARNGAHVIRVGIVGLGKMGLSHLSMFNAHPDVELAAVCDSTGYLLDVLGKYTGLSTFTDYANDARPRRNLDAVIIATPTHLHAAMVRTALEHGLHVFCEKPLCLDPAGRRRADRAGRRARAWSPRSATTTASSAPSREVKRLLDAGAIGRVTHVLGRGVRPGRAEAQGRHLAQPEEPRAAAASTTTPPTRSIC